MQPLEFHDDGLIGRTAKQMIATGMNLATGIRELRKQMIVAALREHQGNICHAARALGAHRNNLYRWMQDLQIADVPNCFRAAADSQRRIRLEGRFPLHSPAIKKIMRTA